VGDLSTPLVKLAGALAIVYIIARNPDGTLGLRS